MLDVGDSQTGDELRLIATSETQPLGPYVTLSHRCKFVDNKILMHPSFLYDFLYLQDQEEIIVANCIDLKEIPKLN